MTSPTTAAAAAARHGPVYQSIVRKLTAALRPTALHLVDETHLHASHAQSPGRPETHFALTVVSPAFAGEPLLARQRRVYAVLQDEMAGAVHALSMKTRTPAEAEARRDAAPPRTAE